MSDFVKVISGTLIALVLCLMLSKHGKDISLLITVAVCCMAAAVAMSYLQPVVDFFDRLQRIGNLDTDMLSVLVKVVGIALLTEITSLVCTDVGNAAMGKVLQILSAAVILWLSVPLLNKLLDLLNEILGAL